FGVTWGPAIFDGEPRSAIEPDSAWMQGYGKPVERVFEPNILANRVVCIEEALGCFAPQGFGNGKNQVIGSIGRNYPKSVEAHSRCCGLDPRISIGWYYGSIVGAALSHPRQHGIRNRNETNGGGRRKCANRRDWDSADQKETFEGAI